MLTHASSSCVINAFLTLGDELLALGGLRLTRFRQDMVLVLQSRDAAISRSISPCS
jgi:hypothetical protein